MPGFDVAWPHSPPGARVSACPISTATDCEKEPAHRAMHRRFHIFHVVRSSRQLTIAFVIMPKV